MASSQPRICPNSANLDSALIVDLRNFKLLDILTVFTQ